jgi:Tub family
LDFKNEKVLPSTKNLQLVRSQYDRVSQVQLVKVKEKGYEVTKTSQVKLIQAFAIAVSVIDSR